MQTSTLLHGLSQAGHAEKFPCMLRLNCPASGQTGAASKQVIIAGLHLLAHEQAGRAHTLRPLLPSVPDAAFHWRRIALSSHVGVRFEKSSETYAIDGLLRLCDHSNILKIPKAHKSDPLEWKRTFIRSWVFPKVPQKTRSRRVSHLAMKCFTAAKTEWMYPSYILKRSEWLVYLAAYRKLAVKHHPVRPITNLV